ncbi:MAG: creatininase family protein, partial [Pseudomonadota bacterium]
MNNKSQSFTGNKFIFLFAVVLSIFFVSPAFAGNVWLEDMTWQEIADALKEGKTTVIIPTGGTEQNGPHIVTGKHNFILKYTAEEIANKLTNTLIAPIIAYVPEGDIN